MTDWKKTKPFPEQKAFVTLLKAHETLLDGVARLLKSKGITDAQYNVLRILRGAGPDGLSCHEVGKRMIKRVPDITRLLDRLEQKNLVGRKRSEDDRRVVMAAITSEGLQLLEQLDKPVADKHREQMAGLTETELTQLTDLLARLAE